MMRNILWLMALLLLAACGGDSPEAATDAGPVVAVKQLVTVDIPPSLSPAERQATRQAIPRSPTAPPPTPTATITPYVGIFLGEAQSGDEAPIIQADPETPVPSGDVTACEIPIDTAFGEQWRNNPSIARRMGCPIQERFGYDAEVQIFERGVMYRRETTNEIWTIVPGRSDAGQFWYNSNPPVTAAEGLEAPPGLFVPTDAFGGVWFADAQIREDIGFASTPVQKIDVNNQRFEGGTLLLDVTVAQVFVLLVNGDVFGPYDIE